MNDKRTTASGGNGIVSKYLGQLRTGRRLVADCLDVMRAHPKMALFPILSILSSIVFFALLLLPLLYGLSIGNGAEYVVLFVLYFTTTFASTFFSASLVVGAKKAFHGEEISLYACTTEVTGHLGPILVWSLISATVSLVLQIADNNDNNLLNAISGAVYVLFSASWSIVTFFVVPVIVFEDVSVRSMFRESLRTFKQVWGETFGAGLGITFITGGIGLLLAVPSFGVARLLFPDGSVLLYALFVLPAFAVTYVFHQTIWAILKTALYLYAKEEMRPSQFENFDFESLGGRTESPESAN
ncbi:DUF6159 family protein [Halorussus pelagicus]|uniref:DUF6159 family protein n=1 Tax=Halorussus pelagicus TaxID=2505977 RepID=UPI000FFC726B|nr:DUF6159 family protein [Halorussus pelagicus]